MLKITTVNKGAELVSVIQNDIEKIHDGVNDWNRHAPVLFPIVGKVKDGKTIIDGKEYLFGQHGFARDMEFEEIGKHSYFLKSNEETLKKYPYNFELYISYEVHKNVLTTKYKVKNTDNKEICFGLGGHPAFKCDYSSGLYRIEFEDVEENLEFYNLKDGLVDPHKLNNKKFMRENRIFLDKDTFKNDAIIVKNMKSKSLFLKTETKAILKFTFEGFKYLGFWSKPGAKFVCIEPWHNTADKVDSDGILMNKEDVIKLKPGEEFESKYSVEFYEV